MTFEREYRYLVLKYKDIDKIETWQQNELFYIVEEINNKRRSPIEAVIVESDWPEYEAVWKMIEDRVVKEQHEQIIQTT